MLNTGKPVFLYYGRREEYELLTMLSSNMEDCGETAKIEIANLKTFLEPYKNIAGIVLQGITFSVIF